MTLRDSGAHPRSASGPVIDWLLDANPSIRWQVLRDLTDTPAETVAAERSRVAAEGWGPRLLDQQRPDGHWGDGVATPAVTEARRRGEEYLLDRRLLRRSSTGEIIDPAWTKLAFPPLWHYDVLRALDVRHRDTLHEELAGAVGAPNRWITLRALRVLDWHARRD